MPFLERRATFLIEPGRDLRECRRIRSRWVNAGTGKVLQVCFSARADLQTLRAFAAKTAPTPASALIASEPEPPPQAVSARTIRTVAPPKPTCGCPTRHRPSGPAPA